MTNPAEIIGPAPGAYLSGNQAQRAECLRLALTLTAGRSVPIQIVWAIARWLWNGVHE